MPFDLAGAAAGHPAGRAVGASGGALRLLRVQGSDAANLPPPPATVTTPDGYVVALCGRGVFWAPLLVHGMPVLCAVDARGDVGNRWRRVPPDASAEYIAAVKAQLWAMLDAEDPPRVALVP